MENKITVLIVDDNTEFRELLGNYMSRYDDIQVLGTAADGFEAVKLIKELDPDIVLLDIVMPNLDGIGVLEKIQELGLKKKPLFVMLTAIGQDIFIQKAITLGAEYYLVKPFSVDILVSRVRQIYNEKNMSAFSDSNTINRIAAVRTVNDEAGTLPEPRTDRQLEAEVTNLIHLIGIPPHIAGYQFIREAIIQSVANTEIFSSITKVLYPSVARKFKTTPQRVERAIRNAIESAWSKKTPEELEALFGNRNKGLKGKPTNSEFINMAANKIKNRIGTV